MSIIHTGVIILFAFKLLYNITEKQFAKGVTLEDMFAHRLPKNMTYYKLWLASRASKMNQIVCCDWLPERARGSYLACTVLPAVSHFPKSHIINPLLAKLVWSRWLDIGLVLFFASLWTLISSRSINTWMNGIKYRHVHLQHQGSIRQTYPGMADVTGYGPY